MTTFDMKATYHKKNGWRFKLLRPEEYRSLFNKSLFFEKIDDVHEYIVKKTGLEVSDAHLQINCMCAGRLIKLHHSYKQDISGTIPHFTPSKMLLLNTLGLSSYFACYQSAPRDSKSFQEAFLTSEKLIKNEKRSLISFLFSMVTANKIRGVVAWVVGIFVSLLLMFFLFKLLDAFGIQGGAYEDEYGDEGVSMYGPLGAAFVFSFMIGARCGMAIYEKNLRGGLDNKGAIQFQSCLIGVLLFGALVSIKDLIFGYDNTYLGLLNFGIGGIILAILYPWYDAKITSLSKEKLLKNDDDHEGESLKYRIFINLMIVAVVAVGLAILGAFAWVGYAQTI